MDRDEILSQLFEHAMHMHTFAIGALMRPGRLASDKAIEETEPFRQTLVRLFQAAGREVPSYLQREDDVPWSKDE